MACSCNQKSVPPTGSTAARDAADRAKAAAQARADNPSTTRIGPEKARAGSGQAQTFALEGQMFGSQLERDAAAARLARR